MYRTFHAIAYFNERRDAMLRGYAEGDPVIRSAHELTFIEANDAIAAASEVFYRLNADDRPNGQTERSLSVGDVIRVQWEEPCCRDCWPSRPQASPRS
jgi:hypothetical protein